MKRTRNSIYLEDLRFKIIKPSIGQILMGLSSDGPLHIHWQLAPIKAVPEQFESHLAVCIRQDMFLKKGFCVWQKK